MPSSGDSPAPSFFTSFRKKALMLLVLPLIPALIAAFGHPRRPSFIRPELPSIRYEQVQGKQHLWIDARADSAFSSGHLPGALSLNAGNYEAQLSQLADLWQPGLRIVVYCDGGDCQSSRAIALRLKRDLGTDDVYILEGGWAATRIP
jgi:rhodanese-related sulfurtransferase